MTGLHPLTCFSTRFTTASGRPASTARSATSSAYASTTPRSADDSVLRGGGRGRKALSKGAASLPREARACLLAALGLLAMPTKHPRTGFKGVIQATASISARPKLCSVTTQTDAPIPYHHICVKLCLLHAACLPQVAVEGLVEELVPLDGDGVKQRLDQVAVEVDGAVAAGGAEGAVAAQHGAVRRPAVLRAPAIACAGRGGGGGSCAGGQARGETVRQPLLMQRPMPLLQRSHTAKVGFRI